MSIKISVTGIAEIDQVLLGMPKELTHNVLTVAHADAAKPLITSAKARVQMDKGNLFNSIGVKKTNLSKVGAIGLVQVGPLRGGKNKGYHGHLIEFGHKIVTRSGKTVGFSRKFPFMEPAFNETKDAIQERIKKSVARKLVSYMRRIIKKYA